MKKLREMKCKRIGTILYPNIDNAITDLKFVSSAKKINGNRKYLKFLRNDGTVEKFRITY